jgi:hypothetical protein
MRWNWKIDYYSFKKTVNEKVWLVSTVIYTKNKINMVKLT